MERFWAKVDRRGPDDCWEWTAGCNRKGYGKFSLDGATRQSHRISWELANGQIPEGLCVLHRCDNPPCCNPAHLFLGTHADNHADRSLKGRHANQRKTHCPNGHEYTPENTYATHGGLWRQCLACRTLRNSSA